MNSTITDERLKELDAAADDVTVYKYRVGLGLGVAGYVQVEADEMKSIASELLAAREALRPFAAMGRQWQVTPKKLTDAETIRAMTYPVDWLAADSALSGNRSGK